MTYEILNNLTPPASATTRTRTRGEFAVTLDSLEVGQGFEYQSEGTLKSQYPRISPKKFGGRRFKMWAVEGKDGTFAVIRQADRVVADAPVVNAPVVNAPVVADAETETDDFEVNA
jgi:hypothetical protein